LVKKYRHFHPNEKENLTKSTDIHESYALKIFVCKFTRFDIFDPNIYTNEKYISVDLFVVCEFSS
jgi:hypothetical protein